MIAKSTRKILGVFSKSMLSVTSTLFPRQSRIVVAVIDRLAEDPEKQGKALVGEWAGYRSIRAVGQRYRVIYRLIDDRIVVCVVAVGIRLEGSRDDVYALARKLFRLRLLEEGEASPPPQGQATLRSLQRCLPLSHQRPNLH